MHYTVSDEIREVKKVRISQFVSHNGGTRSVADALGIDHHEPSQWRCRGNIPEFMAAVIQESPDLWDRPYPAWWLRGMDLIAADRGVLVPGSGAIRMPRSEEQQMSLPLE